MYFLYSFPFLLKVAAVREESSSTEPVCSSGLDSEGTKASRGSDHAADPFVMP